jgi:ribosomal protein S28E/S33
MEMRASFWTAPVLWRFGMAGDLTTVWLKFRGCNCSPEQKRQGTAAVQDAKRFRKIKTKSPFRSGRKGRVFQLKLELIDQIKREQIGVLVNGNASVVFF